VFVVTNKQLAQASNGKHYIKAFVSDRSNQITARMWNASRDIFTAMPDGGFLKVRGRVENYQNNLQIIIEQIWAAKDGTFDVGDLMPHTAKNINQMCQKLTEMVSSSRIVILAAITQAYLDDEKLMTDFCRAPAGTDVPPRFHRRPARAHAQRDRSRRCGSEIHTPASNRDRSSPGCFSTTSPRPGN